MRKKIQFLQELEDTSEKKDLDKSLDLYKVQPWYIEDRGNLRAYGISAPIRLVNVDDLLVIHIKGDMSMQDMEALNMKLRYLFGPFTLVFAFQEDIEFLTVKKMTAEERNCWIKTGERLIEGNKHEHVGNHSKE